MNTPRHPTPDNDEAIEAMAASWLVQKEEGFTREQAAEFARWRDADPRHAQALAMLEETCAILEKMPQVRRELATESETAAANKVVRFPRVFKIVAALAACVALAAIAWWGFRPTRLAEAVTFAQTYTTSTDGYQRFVLPDASVVELNADSEVRVEFSDSFRRVTLSKGEAHFTVAKNPARPFLVSAGHVAVRAVGTAFDVRLTARDVEVLVTEGRVQVNKTGGAVAERADQFVAGQRIVVANDDASRMSARVSTVDSSAIRHALAWQSPRLVFVDTPLSDVARQFNEHNRVQLVIGDEELGKRAVAGTFRADQVETFVRVLETSGAFTVERPEAERIILRKRPQ